MRYTEDHEWLTKDGNEFTVGITEYAASQLGDIVFIELPDIGAKVECGSEVAVVESVKAASEINAPASGTIVGVNAAVADEPAIVSNDPLHEGWFFKMEFDEPEQFDQFMSEDQYNELIA